MWFLEQLTLFLGVSYTFALVVSWRVANLQKQSKKKLMGEHTRELTSLPYVHLSPRLLEYRD